MNRNIILYSVENFIKTDNFSEYIHINNIDSIVNCSVDGLFCDCLEMIEEHNLGITIQTLAKKIRPNGYLTIKIMDIKRICLDYLQNKLESKKFIQFFKDKSSTLLLDTISMNIDSNIFITSKINSEDYFLSIVLQKRQK